MVRGRVVPGLPGLLGASILTLVLCQRASAVESDAAGDARYDAFPRLLDQLRDEPDAGLRGGDSLLRESRGVGRQVIELVGRPDTYDPFGSRALRDAVIERWRRRWEAQGPGFLQGTKEAAAVEGRQDLDFGPIHLTRNVADMGNVYYLAGPRMYAIGAMDGSFPPLGRQLGDQGGLWAHPVKVLDGFAYTLAEDGLPDWPLTGGRHYAHDLASGRFHYERENLRAIRQDFVAEDAAAYFTRLTLQNKTARARTLTLRFSGAVNLRGSWASGLPNDLDQIADDAGWIDAVDPGLEGGRVRFGSNRAADAQRIEENVATLSYTIHLPAHGTATRTFLIQARPDDDEETRRRKFQEIVAAADRILHDKEQKYRRLVFDGVRFSSDDKHVEQAFYLAKANLQLLTADLRPYFPAPYFFAGLPVYMQLFANDASYSIPGATAAGFADTARGTLVSLADQARRHGGFPHETTTRGRMVGPSNSQETQQVIGAAWRYFQWTGDVDFIRDFYPQALQSLQFASRRFDGDGDGYFEGSGLIETPNMGPKKLDSALYLYAAYTAIAGMAGVLGEETTARQFEQRAAAFKKRFNKDWWIASEDIWADSLGRDNAQKLDGYWTVIFPQQVGVAAPGHAQTALDTIERGWVNHWGGVHTRQPDITGQGSGVVTTNLFASTLFRFGRADSAWKLVQAAARAPLEDRILGQFVETIPPGQSDFIQLWSVGPFLESIIEGLGGIQPDATAHRITMSSNLPRSLGRYAIDGLKMGTHTLNISHRRDGAVETKTLSHASGDRPLQVTLICPAHGSWTVNVDTAELTPKCRRSEDDYFAVFDAAVPAGASVRISRPTAAR